MGFPRNHKFHKNPPPFHSRHSYKNNHNNNRGNIGNSQRGNSNTSRPTTHLAQSVAHASYGAPPVNNNPSPLLYVPHYGTTPPHAFTPQHNHASTQLMQQAQYGAPFSMSQQPQEPLSWCSPMPINNPTVNHAYQPTIAHFCERLRMIAPQLTDQEYNNIVGSVHSDGIRNDEDDWTG